MEKYVYNNMEFKNLSELNKYRKNKERNQAIRDKLEGFFNKDDVKIIVCYKDNLGVVTSFEKEGYVQDSYTVFYLGKLPGQKDTFFVINDNDETSHIYGKGLKLSKHRTELDINKFLETGEFAWNIQYKENLTIPVSYLIERARELGAEIVDNNEAYDRVNLSEIRGKSGSEYIATTRTSYDEEEHQ